MKAVILAGGMGKRMRPLTYAIPKPLLPVGKRPVLEILLEQLREAGFDEICLPIHYCSEIIQSYFRDGTPFGVTIRYSVEREPLGTAGPILAFRDHLTEPFLVVNGDLVTGLDFRKFYEAHVAGGADMTVAVRAWETRIPYGVLEMNGAGIRSVREKPALTHYISAGIYACNPSVLGVIPEGRRFEMPEMINALARSGRKVLSYPFDDYWIDLGKIDDYERAIKKIGRLEHAGGSEGGNAAGPPDEENGGQ